MRSQGVSRELCGVALNKHSAGEVFGPPPRFYVNTEKDLLKKQNLYCVEERPVLPDRAAFAWCLIVIVAKNLHIEIDNYTCFVL